MAYLLVFTTVPTKKEAQKIAGILLAERLAACVHVAPAGESHYRWKGRKEKAKEFILWIKTKDTLFSRLEKAVRRSHSYEVPELIAFSVRKGSSAYLSWLSREVRN